MVSYIPETSLPDANETEAQSGFAEPTIGEGRVQTITEKVLPFRPVAQPPLFEMIHRK
jgi:hypothetical protein